MKNNLFLPFLLLISAPAFAMEYPDGQQFEDAREEMDLDEAKPRPLSSEEVDAKVAGELKILQDKHPDFVIKLGELVTYKDGAIVAYFAVKDGNGQPTEFSIPIQQATRKIPWEETRKEWIEKAKKTVQQIESNHNLKNLITRINKNGVNCDGHVLRLNLSRGENPDEIDTSKLENMFVLQRMIDSRWDKSRFGDCTSLLKDPICTSPRNPNSGNLGVTFPASYFVETHHYALGNHDVFDYTNKLLERQDPETKLFIPLIYGLLLNSGIQKVTYVANNEGAESYFEVGNKKIAVSNLKNDIERSIEIQRKHNQGMQGNPTSYENHAYDIAGDNLFSGQFRHISTIYYLLKKFPGHFSPDADEKMRETIAKHWNNVNQKLQGLSQEINWLEHSLFELPSYQEQLNYICSRFNPLIKAETK